jgi:YegS/Rv2252/BmrU family lipid kinase
MGAVSAREVVLIVNPSAGGGRGARALPAVQARLRELGFALRTQSTRDLTHARELAADSARAGSLTATLGGDGLAGAVAGVIREHPGAVMGVLPGGRGNDFARANGISMDPVAACEVIAGGHERLVDVGDVDGRTFIGIASLGFDSFANHHANQAPARLGRGVYLYGALRTLATYRHATFTVTIDGAPDTFTGWSVAAANGPSYGGGMQVAPGADLHDGQLDVVLIRATSRLRFLRTLPTVFAGEHVHHPMVDVVRGVEVRIVTDHPLPVYADGDPIAVTPCTVRAIPDAIRVLLPA